MNLFYINSVYNLRLGFFTVYPRLSVFEFLKNDKHQISCLFVFSHFLAYHFLRKKIIFHFLAASIFFEEVFTQNQCHEKWKNLKHSGWTFRTKKKHIITGQSHRVTYIFVANAVWRNNNSSHEIKRKIQVFMQLNSSGWLACKKYIYVHEHRMALG